MIARKLIFARCGEVVRLLTSPPETKWTHNRRWARIAGFGAVKRPLATSSKLAHNACSVLFIELGKQDLEKLCLQAK
jgi:hypothetical protein